MQQQMQASKQAASSSVGTNFGGEQHQWMWAASMHTAKEKEKEQRKGIWQQRKGKYNTGQYKGSKGYGGYQRQREDIQQRNTNWPRQPFQRRKGATLHHTASHSSKGKAKGKAKGKQAGSHMLQMLAILDTTPGTAEYQCITWKMQQRHHTTQQQHGMNNITHMMHNGGTCDIQSQQQLALPAPTPIQAVTTMPPAPTQTTPPQIQFISGVDLAVAALSIQHDSKQNTETS